MNASGDGVTIGVWRGCVIDLIAHDAVTAPVELSTAGIFTRERGGQALRGGLRHLDEAFGGAVRRLRADGIVSGAPGETFLLSTPPPPVAARAVLLVGLGAPDDWTAASLALPLTRAIEQAMRLEVASAAFAPGLLDSGFAPAETVGASCVMLDAVLDALAEPPSRLARWCFCVGAKRLEPAAEAFRAVFASRADR